MLYVLLLYTLCGLEGTRAVLDSHGEGWVKHTAFLTTGTQHKAQLLRTWQSICFRLLVTSLAPWRDWYSQQVNYGREWAVNPTLATVSWSSVVATICLLPVWFWLLPWWAGNPQTSQLYNTTTWHSVKWQEPTGLWINNQPTIWH